MIEPRQPSSALRERYFAAGHWTDETFASFVEQAVGAARDRPFRIWSDTRPYEGTLGELFDAAARLATSLAKRGIGAGDVIAYQVPNWVEAVVTLFAGFRLGAVLVPIVHFYGPREVEFILRQSGARVLVTVDHFAGVDHLEPLEGIRSGLPGLECVIVIATGDPALHPAGMLSFSSLVDASSASGSAGVDPDLPAMIGYTSGTTAEPKGVVHSHRTLLAEVAQLAGNARHAQASLSASPLAHMTGMLGALLIPLHLGLPIHLTDRWDPQAALRILREADITLGGGATIFLTSLLDAEGFGPEDVARMPSVGLGGSPVPAAVGERADALGITTYRSYGSTEHPSITGSSADATRRARIHTDGPPLPGVEIRIVDGETEREVAPGMPGQILSRGPDLFVGYSNPDLTARAMTEDGWYRTGDVGVLDDQGQLTITDRLSDIIIRGGANLSAAELEESLMRLPSVTECAVVAAPDDRLGEKALAFLRLRAEAEPPDLAAVQAHLGSDGMPRQKWVEGVRIVDDFPRTPSGKIRKFVLRDGLRSGQY